MPAIITAGLTFVSWSYVLSSWPAYEKTWPARRVPFIHDQPFRAISLGVDAHSAVEMIYLPAASHKDKEIYGQVESQVKRVYGARIGWTGWDIYD